MMRAFCAAAALTFAGTCLAASATRIDVFQTISVYISFNQAWPRKR